MEIPAIIELTSTICILLYTAYVNIQPKDLVTPDENTTLLSSSSDESEIIWPDRLDYCVPHPDNTPCHDNLPSRVLRRFPFVVEIAYYALVYMIVVAVKALNLATIYAHETTRVELEALGRSNALSVLKFEHEIPLDFERLLQITLQKNFMLWVMALLGYIIRFQYVLTVVLLCYEYTFFPQETYYSARRALALQIILALGIKSFFRCTAPKYMPAEFGYIDPADPLKPLPENPVGDPMKEALRTVVVDLLDRSVHFWVGRGNVPDVLDGGRVLRIAAMPSLGFGNSLLMGVVTVKQGKHLWMRVLALMYPILMLVSVIGTGEAWAMSCVVGAALVFLAWNGNRLLLVLRPVEEIILHLLRIEKPRRID